MSLVIKLCCGFNFSFRYVLYTLLHTSFLQRLCLCSIFALQSKTKGLLLVSKVTAFDG